VSTAQGKLTHVLRSLHHRNFRLFFSGQLISLVGTWMQLVAQSWLVYRLTNSPVLLGAVGFAGQIPVFLIAPVAGAITDRHNRHRIVIATQSASMILAFILAGLTLTGQVHVIHVMGLAALLGIVNAFDIPARQSFMVEMVGRQDLGNAIALNSSMFNGARIVGPAVAGIMVGAIGEGWCFFANAVSYIAVIAGLLMMRVGPTGRERSTKSATELIREGFTYSWQTLPVRFILLLLGTVSLLGMPFAVLMPIFADRILHGGAEGLGILMGASGVGALSAALVMAARTGVKGLGRWVMLSCAGFGAGLVVFSLSRWFWLSVALQIPIGFCLMVQMASSNTLIQTLVPDRLRGRVMSVYSMMFMGMAPFGSLLAGGLANHLGAPMVVALSGTASILAATVFGRTLPAFRVEARRIILAQMASAGVPEDEVTNTGVEAK
jgi:MFS family permease